MGLHWNQPLRLPHMPLCILKAAGKFAKQLRASTTMQLGQRLLTAAGMNETNISSPQVFGKNMIPRKRFRKRLERMLWEIHSFSREIQTLRSS